MECCNKYRVWDYGEFIRGAVDEYLATGVTTETLDIFAEDNWGDLDDETIMERVSSGYVTCTFKDVDELLWFYGKFPGTPVTTRGVIYTEIPGIAEA
ncbi:hypothetical protein BGZ82_011603 [Podila clonocystis]|nr:hypothetical protein BGZ82_011603 [Podila clonocystis]